MYFDQEENQEFLEALANRLWSAADMSANFCAGFNRGLPC